MRRIFMLFAAITFFVSACSISTRKISPTETTIASVTAIPTFTGIAPVATPTKQQPTSTIITQPTTIVTGWVDQLEVISSKNWGNLQLLQTFPAEMPMQHSAVAISPEGKTIAVGGSSKAQIFFFDLESGRISTTLSISDAYNVNKPFKVIQYLSDGSIMASSDGPYTIYHISKTGKVLAAWDGIEFAISADHKIVAVDTNEGTLLIDMATKEPITTLKDTNGLGFSFAPDTSKIAIDVVTVDDLNVDIWDIKSQKVITSLAELRNASYSPNGKFLAAFDDANNSIKIFSPDGALEITTLKDAHFEYLISPDGSFVAYQTIQGSYLAQDTTSWEPTESTLSGTLDSFSSDGKILITRKADGAISVWGVLKGNG